MTNCYLRSILHRFRDTASQSRKLPTLVRAAQSRGPPSNFAVQLTMLKVKTLRYFHVKILVIPTSVILSQYTRVTDDNEQTDRR